MYLNDKEKVRIALELSAQEPDSEKTQHVRAYELCEFLRQFQSLYSLIWAMCSYAYATDGRDFISTIKGLIDKEEYKKVRKLTIEKIRQDSEIWRKSRRRQASIKPRQRYANQYSRGGKLSIISITHTNPLEIVFMAHPLVVVIALAMLEARDAYGNNWVIERMTHICFKIRPNLLNKEGIKGAARKAGYDLILHCIAEFIKDLFDNYFF